MTKTCPIFPKSHKSKWESLLEKNYISYMFGWNYILNTNCCF